MRDGEIQMFLVVMQNQKVSIEDRLKWCMEKLKMIELLVILLASK